MYLKVLINPCTQYPKPLAKLLSVKKAEQYCQVKGCITMFPFGGAGNGNSR